ncbi:MAG: hypothetical protein J7K46_00955 [Bacteroidales bacterium]|nr:hypothetical protein [Bacteroidales bacterium]
MKSFRLLILCLCVFAVAACEKDKLEGEMSILIGTWNWTETYEVRNHCDADTLWNYQLIDSTQTHHTYSLEFLEKGKVIFYTNHAIIWKERVVFESKNVTGEGPYKYHFVILLNNNINNKMDVWVGQDSLLLNDFPKDTDDNCSEMFNHFIRQ